MAVDWTPPSIRNINRNKLKVDKSPDGANLVITVPIDYDLPLSKTGKSHVLYTAGHGFFNTDIWVNGEEVAISLTVYIKRLKGR